MLSRKSLLAPLFAAVLVLVMAVASYAASAPKPEDAFRASFPQVPIDAVYPTEIPGLYEMVSGQNVFYYYPAKDIVLTGEMIGKDLKSRTSERKASLAAAQVKNLPLDKAVKVGDGKKVVIEFTDPDCPYCRKAFEYFSKRSDVTQYVFFAPLAHPGAMPKIQYILGAENKAAAFDAMMLGQDIPKDAPQPTEAVKALAQEHLALAKKVGIQGTPTFFINGEPVVGADVPKLDQLLK
ncbi:DsbC family protein [Geomesophilobacter sediminis]|uniref:DsbC family protein n=1 Tax=Geomesophilobacter sediminis TaxID=2798584 RepID=A0A8J7M1M5_9BACT|nr:DsbC family protein [Geomesophilobacter sediminis]MBJ6726768.1 DsbC family protein [Geomesophilobacter sediminis]